MREGAGGQSVHEGCLRRGAGGCYDDRTASWNDAEELRERHC